MQARQTTFLLVRKNRVAALLAAMLALLALRSLFSEHVALAVLAYSLLLAGIAQRRKRALHLPLMGAGMGLDLALVASLQLQRDAVGTAAALSLGWPQQLHILFSLLAVLLYFPAAYLGWRRWRGASAPGHRAVGIAAFTFRTLGLLFMFTMRS